MSDLARVMQAFEDSHREDSRVNQDELELLVQFLLLTSAHLIPAACLSNELVIKLTGKAARWFHTAIVQCAARIGSRRILRPAQCQPPPWYHRARGCPTGHSSQTGLALSLKGVTLTAGPNKQLAYIYQTNSLRKNSAAGQLQLISTKRCWTPS